MYSPEVKNSSECFNAVPSVQKAKKYPFRLHFSWNFMSTQFRNPDHSLYISLRDGGGANIGVPIGKKLGGEEVRKYCSL